MNREDYERLSARMRLTDRQLDVATKEVVTNRIALLQAMVRVGLIPCPLCDGEEHEVLVDGRRYVAS